MNYKIPVIIIILALILISGYFVTTGYFLRDARIGALVDSANEWLETDFGQKSFPDTIATEPYKVLDFPNMNDVSVWLIPLKKGNVFVGYIETSNVEDIPGTFTTFAEPSDTIFKMTRDGAFTLMLEFTDYSAAQLKKPILVNHRKTIMWYTPVYSNGKEIDYLEVPAMWAIDEIVFDQHGEIKRKEKDY